MINDVLLHTADLSAVGRQPHSAIPSFKSSSNTALDPKPDQSIQHKFSLPLVNKPFYGINLEKLLIVPRRPRDPYDYRPPDSDQVIEFYGYGSYIVLSQLYECFIHAHRDYYEKHGLMERDLVYSDRKNEVFMHFYPGEQMTWDMWKETLAGILDFFTLKLSVSLSFIVLQDGVEGDVGKGSISQASDYPP